MTQLTRMTSEVVLLPSRVREIGKRFTSLRFGIFAAACLLPLLAFGQTPDVWKGGAGNWSNMAMWSNGVPSATSNVFIDNGKAGASAVTVDINPGQAANVTIDGDDTLIVGNGSTLHVGGTSVSNAGTLGVTAFSGFLFFDGAATTISNAGTIPLNAVSGGTVGLNVSGTATLKGAGSVTMTNVAGNFIMGPFQSTPGASLTNQSTIQGSGGIGGINGIGTGNTFVNQGTINANQSTPLILTGSTSQTLNNTGTLEATAGGTLELAGGTWTNTLGTIHADPSSTVLLQGGPTSGTTINGGTFTTSGTGVIADNCCFNTSTLNGVTIGTGSVFQLNTNHGEMWQGTITNNGTFEINDQGNFGTDLLVSGSVTVKGTGKIVMGNDTQNRIMDFGQPSPGASLTNQITIQGAGLIGGINGIGNGNSFINQGTINANQPDALVITGSTGQTLTNTGTMEATAGGTLELAGGTFTNTGGTIHADLGSKVILQGGPTSGTTITGGTLSTAGTGLIQDNCCFNNSTLNGVTIATGSVFQLNTNHPETWAGTITNNGTFQINDQNNFGTDLNMSGAVILTGTGKIMMSNDTQNRIMGFGQASPGASLTNHITIQGSGQFGAVGGIGSGNSLINQGTIFASQKNPIVFLLNSGSLSNLGTLKVKAGSVMDIAGTGFTNFSGTTLSGGKYMVNGTLEFDGANIVTNSAGITLTGAAAQIINSLTAANALANFSANTATGSFSLLSGKSLNTTVSTGNFTNAGKVTIGVGSGLQISAPPMVSPTYTQSSGTTTVDGVLAAAGGVTIQSGMLFGKGTIAASVVSSGSVTAGDSFTKAGKLSPSTYTQNPKGSLNIPITGLTAGTQYGQLAVANGVSLNGILNIKRMTTFVPAIGTTFTIVTGSAVTGKFAVVNGLAINASEHFALAVNPTSVTLTVVAGP